MAELWTTLFENTDVVLLVIALNAVGFTLKRVPCVPSTWIPGILGAVGILAYQGMATFSVRNALIGVVCGAAAIGGHRLVKDYLAEPDENKKPIPPEPGSVSQ